MAPFDQQDYDFTSPRVETPVQDDVLRCLIEARKLIEMPDRWHQGSIRCGERRCAYGALSKGKSESEYGPLWDYLTRFVPNTFWCPSVPVFNDDPATTHADVLALFDRAIAARRAEADHG